MDASSSEQAGHGPMEASVPTCQSSIVNSAANFPVQQSARPRSPTMSVGVPDAVLGFFPILLRQLSREETIEVIETKGAMVSSEPGTRAYITFAGRKTVRVTFSALTLMINETAEVLNCNTVLEEFSFDLESFVMSSPIRSHSRIN